LITVGKDFPATSLHSLKSKTSAAKKASFHSGYNAFLISLRITWAEVGGMDDRQGTRRHVQVFTDVLFRGKYLPSVKAVNAAVYYHMTQGMLELKDKVHILMATILVLGLLLFTAGGRSNMDLRALRWAATETHNKARFRDSRYRGVPSGVEANSGVL